MFRVAYTDMEDPGDDVHYTSPTSILDVATRRRDREIDNGNSAWVEATETRWVHYDAKTSLSPSLAPTHHATAPPATKPPEAHTPSDATT